MICDELLRDDLDFWDYLSSLIFLLTALNSPIFDHEMKETTEMNEENG